MKELDKERQQAILKILNFIQDGGELEEAKKMFQAAFDQVDVAEITAAERELIAQGLDPRKIQYLCNVHADVFKGNIKENKENSEFEKPGHPVHTFKLENIVLKSLVNDALLPDLAKWEKGDKGVLSKLRQELKDLAKIHYHYARKETSMFPIMTKYGITAPPKVMWGVDDKIRKLIGQANLLISQKDINKAEVSKAIKETAHEVLEMIFKEEEIMLPMIDEVASEEDWGNVKNEEEQIGYTLIQKPMNWKPKEKPKSDGPISIDKLSSLALNFAEGSLNLEQLSAILDLLPFALTFIDENDKVAYFGGGANIFPHSKNALGNSVYSCHLPESVPRVKKIFDDFHQGKKDKYEFWFKPRHMGRYLYLQYFAVRKDNKYLGCLEVAQDVTDIRNWKNEKK
ncbi:MAG: DUF438 domain-containing protein [Lactobacillus johnsonii]|uniref:DUF438 domain-containing protein n=1 Tax=Lactobacillus johnsonii TaxID=33959 RepID=UPI0021A6F5AC|nr:DUF438 domain-containing protein [Lactobacillus johnsonii]MCT3386325.1 DUF438 domain-containing protein [Lactobacillus johnsonii]MDD7006238.1 DUF438 domain-containing protein [Lactobacillus johnsonii]MDY6195359.1 DUF438 domain-containing protein [Lactobacillus johnsonii]